MQTSQIENVKFVANIPDGQHFKSQVWVSGNLIFVIRHQNEINFEDFFWMIFDRHLHRDYLQTE